jgi:hypothetical protein
VSRAAVRGGEPPPVPQGATTAAFAPAPMPSSTGGKDGKGKSTGSGYGSGSGSNAPASAPVSSAPAAPTVFPREDRKAKAQARQRAADATRSERNELAQIDKRLAALVKEKTETEAALAKGGKPGSELAELGRHLNHIAADTAKLEERWLELQAVIEAAVGV